MIRAGIRAGIRYYPFKRGTINRQAALDNLRLRVGQGDKGVTVMGWKALEHRLAKASNEALCQHLSDTSAKFAASTVRQAP